MSQDQTLAKPVFTVLICGGGADCDPSEYCAPCQSIRFIIKSEWQQKYTLRFIYFKTESELLKLAGEQTFDLIVLYLFNVEWETMGHKPFVGQPEFLARLRSKHGKPIIAMQGIDLEKQFQGTGVHFLQAPYELETLRSVLRPIFEAHSPNSVADKERRQGKAVSDSLMRRDPKTLQEITLPMKHPVRIVLLDDEEWFTEMVQLAISERYENISMVVFHDGYKAWDELQRADPDLFITDMNHGKPSGWEMLPKLGQIGVKYPILVLSGLAKEREVMDLAGSELNLAFLQKPFTLDEFDAELSKRLGSRLKLRVPKKIESTPVLPIKPIVSEKATPSETIAGQSPAKALAPKGSAERIVTSATYSNFRSAVAKVIVVSLLLAALGPRSHDYYTLLRLAACGIFAHTSLQCWQKKYFGWMFVFAGAAVLHNPIAPIGIKRETWAYIDPAAALLLLISIVPLDVPRERKFYLPKKAVSFVLELLGSGIAIVFPR